MMKQVPFSSNRDSRLDILCRCRLCYTVRLWLYTFFDVEFGTGKVMALTTHPIISTTDQAPSEKTKVWIAARRAKVAFTLSWNTWFAFAGCRLGNVRAAAVELSKSDQFVILWVGQFLQGVILLCILLLHVFWMRFCQSHRMYTYWHMQTGGSWWIYRPGFLFGSPWHVLQLSWSC